MIITTYINRNMAALYLKLGGDFNKIVILSVWVITHRSCSCSCTTVIILICDFEFRDRALRCKFISRFI